MASPVRKVRCAVYTRKSTDEGLDQAFNSLDAQREACTAYVASQRHEGWELAPDPYDDGGYSGGSMDRPALRQLLADVEAGRVDVIVVYKVDRLTRSLADFAKIVEVLDARGASFVSVTQSFNTTTSMGRLTLNVLLSFAQFEREVTGERIRDKIAASKAKGMWMGGPVPLGYEVQDRNLLINDSEAELVRHLFGRYVELRSIAALVDELARSPHRTKLRTYKCGRTVGGVMFGKGMLASLLQNRIYVGEIVHKGTAAPGRHKGIIAPALFDRVQAIIAHNRCEQARGARASHPSLLAGMLFDGEGRPFTTSHATKGSRRYRYYVTRTLTGDAAPKTRVPSGEIERVVIDLVRRQLSDIGAAAQRDGEEAHALYTRLQAQTDLAERLPGMGIADQRKLLLSVKAHVVLTESEVSLSVGGNKTVALIQLVDRGSDVRLALSPDRGSGRTDPDPVLLRLMVHGFAARDAIFSGRPNPLVASYSAEHVMKLFRLTCLAPDIISSILDGRQPPTLTGRKLLRAPHVPHLWDEQRRLFGFA